MRIVSWLALLQLVAQLLMACRYGIFRDELYYLACADRLAWGYVDHPPLSIAVLAAFRAVLGDALWAIRLPVALAASGVIIVGALLARELGGRRFAQGLVALCLAIAPIVLVIGGYYSMNVFEQLFWLLGAWLLVRILRVAARDDGLGDVASIAGARRDGTTRLWLALGVVIGLGLLNKVSMGVFALAMTGGLLLTAHRRQLARRGFWLTVGVSALLFLPHVLWQAANGWPTFEFAANAMRNKISAMNPLGFVLENALEVHPANLIIWLPGLLWLLAGGGRRYRIIAWTFLLALIVMLLQKTKPYYLSPAYLMLLAAGAVAVEGFLDRRWCPWAKPVLIVWLALGGLFTLPMALPVLPPGAAARYLAVTRLQPNTGEDIHGVGGLPQYFADRFAWREQAEAVAAAFATLTDEERAGCAILCRNYGQAGAVEYFARGRGLPDPCCGHNNYYLWWPAGAVGETAIAVGFRAEELGQLYESVEVAAVLDVPFAIRSEGRIPIHLCRGLKMPLAEAKPRFRYYG